MPQVTIYTTPSCVYCKMVKSFFQEHQVVYQEKNVAIDAVARNEMIDQSGQMGVPVIDVGGKIIIGFDQPRLKEILEIE